MNIIDRAPIHPVHQYYLCVERIYLIHCEITDSLCADHEALIYGMHSRIESIHFLTSDRTQQ